MARTWKVWPPTARPLKLWGDVQDENGAPSSEHSKVEPSSLDENAKLALVTCVIAGGVALIVVCGAVVSTIVQIQAAGVGSTLPEASTARASNVCRPAPRFENMTGSPHSLQALSLSLSRRHSNSRCTTSPSITSVLSVPVRPKRAVPVLLGSSGPLVISVFGGVVSSTSHS